MIIELLRSFGATGFNLSIEKGIVSAKDNNGNPLKEGQDYRVIRKDANDNNVTEVTQASGISTYTAPK